MISEAVVHHVSMPMKRSFAHARAARTVADNLVVVLRLAGREGVGESVPRAYVTGETPEGAMAALRSLDLRAISQALVLSDFSTAVRSVEELDLPRRLHDGTRAGQAAACAIELALLDAIGKAFGQPLSAAAAALALAEPLRQRPGGRHRVSRALDYSRSPEEFLAETPGTPHHIKVKVGLAPSEDLARLQSLRRLVGDIPLSADANMAWSVDQAIEMTRQLMPLRLAWYEEPLAKGELRGYRRLRQETGSKVMLDESVCTMAEARAAIGEGACDLLNIRLSKCGGFLPSLRLAELAHQNGLGFQLGIQVGEMGVLGAAGRHFVEAVRGATAYEGCAADLFFAQQIIQEDLGIDRTTYTCAALPGAGLGVTVNRDVLARYTCSEQRWDGSAWS